MYALAAFGIEVDQNNPAGLAKFILFYSLKNQKISFHVEACQIAVVTRK
jgi:hypothetical protein